MNPFNTFGPDDFTYLKQICVQIKENITGKTASGFLLFGKIQGQKSQFMNLALLKHNNISDSISWAISNFIKQNSNLKNHIVL